MEAGARSECYEASDIVFREQDWAGLRKPLRICRPFFTVVAHSRPSGNSAEFGLHRLFKWEHIPQAIRSIGIDEKYPIFSLAFYWHFVACRSRLRQSFSATIRPSNLSVIPSDEGISVDTGVVVSSRLLLPILRPPALLRGGYTFPSTGTHAPSLPGSGSRGNWSSGTA
jgi:hypothetical protein